MIVLETAHSDAFFIRLLERREEDMGREGKKKKKEKVRERKEERRARRGQAPS